MSDPTVETKIHYNATIEQRAGKLFAVVERTVDETPISNRGREYSKGTSRRTVQVIPFREVENLIAALTDSMVWAIATPTADGVLNRGDEQSYGLFWDADLVDSFWSNAEAEEAGRSYVERNKPTGRVTTRHLPGGGLNDLVTVIQ